ncbi:MAG TPA: hypothetical protein VGC79_21400, partial [Polyangiaceae bacterium]
MSRETLRLRRSLSAALLGAVGVLSGVLGCQSLADIPDVSYSAICNEYCDSMFNECTGPNKQYDDPQTCLESCLLLDKNADYSTAKEGNTIACRLSRLSDAANSGPAVTDRAASCAQAGPGGGSSCTAVPKLPDCEGYCSLYVVACGGESSNPFAGLGLGLDIDNAGDQNGCIDKCNAVVPMSGDYNAQSAKSSGDTLACRLYFATKAVEDPKTYCDRAGLRPSGECLGKGIEPNCPSFCRALVNACLGDMKVYEDQTQCEAVCKATEPGAKQAIATVDTVGCRSAHAFNALLISPKDHCPYIGPLGAGVCGDAGNCVAYCHLTRAACQVEYDAHFTDNEDCQDQCSMV